jgi:hypothetical protein
VQLNKKKEADQRLLGINAHRMDIKTRIAEANTTIGSMKKSIG